MNKYDALTKYVKEYVTKYHNIPEQYKEEYLELASHDEFLRRYLEDTIDFNFYLLKVSIKELIYAVKNSLIK